MTSNDLDDPQLDADIALAMRPTTTPSRRYVLRRLRELRLLRDACVDVASGGYSTCDECLRLVHLAKDTLLADVPPTNITQTATLTE